MTGDAWHEWLMNAPPSEIEGMKKAFAEGGYNAVDAFFRPKGRELKLKFLNLGSGFIDFEDTANLKIEVDLVPLSKD